jgi:hypothetical protein
MKRSAAKKAIIGIAVCCGSILGTWILNNRIRIDREERERHFVTVHFIAMESVGAPDDEVPKTIEELMEMYAGGGSHSSLLKPFTHGLEYRRTGGGFEIAEPRRETVSLLRRDRLIASDRDWPHWESSGAKVWKFPGQTIPPNYLNTKAEQDARGNGR